MYLFIFLKVLCQITLVYALSGHCVFWENVSVKCFRKKTHSRSRSFLIKNCKNFSVAKLFNGRGQRSASLQYLIRIFGDDARTSWEAFLQPSRGEKSNRNDEVASDIRRDRWCRRGDLRLRSVLSPLPVQRIRARRGVYKYIMRYFWDFIIFFFVSIAPLLIS